MFDQIAEFIGKDNHFFQGGLVLMIFGSIAVWGKKVPIYLFEWLKRFFFCTVTFRENTELFKLFEDWINNQDVFSKKRIVMLNLYSKSDVPKLEIVADRRSYFVKINGARCIIRKGEDEISGAGNENRPTLQPREQYWITFSIFNKKKVMKMFDDILEKQKPGSKTVPVYTCPYLWWEHNGDQEKTNIDSIILNKGLKQEIVNDINLFFDSHDWYKNIQRPYNRGYIFYGPPGTGKTSLSTAIASHFNLRLCVLNLGIVSDDKSLMSLFYNLPSRALVLIEDFDSFFNGREAKKEGKVTFSGVLNAINGAIHCSPGRILIISTNEIDSIDPALMRPGRIDKAFKLDYIDEYQASKFISNFRMNINSVDKNDSKWNVFKEKILQENIAPVELIDHLCNNRFNEEDAYDFDKLMKTIQKDKK